MFPSVGPSLLSLLRGLRDCSSSTPSYSSSVPSSTALSREDLKEIDSIVEDVEQVQKIYEGIGAILADAEERRIWDKSVQLWLHELKDLADKVQDMLDVYEYEVVARQVESPFVAASSFTEAAASESGMPEISTHKVRSSLSRSISPLLDSSFRLKIARDVKRISKQFNSIENRRQVFCQERSDGRRFRNDLITDRSSTGYLPPDPVFVGREQELVKLRNMLVNPRSIEVMAVIGMGGIGKTTLAQHVFNDREVIGSFDMRGWIHASVSYDVTRLTKAVIDCFSSSSCGFEELSRVQEELTKLVEDKKILLVVDDVWNENSEYWETFIVPIGRASKHGSKILITTRFRKIADAARAVSFLELSNLSADDGWTLLKKHAFPSQTVRVQNLKELEEIGKRITGKCGGLPLSIKVLGSLLRSKGYHEDCWRDVLESNLLNFHEVRESRLILGSLYLSYLYLPPKLKACFRSCCIYPKDDINVKSLQHFLLAYAITKDEEDGNRCLQELESSSFLQLGPTKIQMHDHIYDLAQYVSGEEHLTFLCSDRVPEKQDEDLFSSTRNASICIKEKSPTLEVNIFHENIRTLVMDGRFDSFDKVYISVGPCLRVLHICTFPDPAVFILSVDSLKCLRILHLSRLPSIPRWVFQLYNLQHLEVDRASGETRLPDDVCKLKNLRSMKLNCPSMRYLPESISSLINLRELNLRGCRNLEELPAGIIHLTNLESLNFEATKITFMPDGFGGLIKLRCLTHYLVGSSSAPSQARLIGLKNMRHLKDELKIHNLCHVQSEEDAQKAELAKKKHLRKLTLKWGPAISCHKACIKKQELVLQNLRPHDNIEELSIYDYPGFKLPTWMGDGSFTNLVSLLLDKLFNCSSISPIDQLPSLQKLYVFNMDSLVEIDGDTLPLISEQTPPFPKLEMLTIESCGRLQSLRLDKLTSLKHAMIYSCTNLKYISPTYDVPFEMIIGDCPHIFSLRRTPAGLFGFWHAGAWKHSDIS